MNAAPPAGTTAPRAGPPLATYRLQFHAGFTLGDATAILPYLRALGISHVYASPLLKARAGSTHGYDIVDHGHIDPRLGGREGFEQFVQRLHELDLRLLLDIVPNHMGVGGDDNAWWLDVLEHGQAAPCAAYFDIDWRPPAPALRDRLLLPFLAGHYGTELESGAIRLELDAAAGRFSARYGSHLLPLDPRSYPEILAPLATGADAAGAGSDAGLPALEALCQSCRALPRRAGGSPRRRARRQEESARCQAVLAGLLAADPVLRARVEQSVARLNGVPGEPASFDALHRLLELQAWRLAHWQVAADEVNYRRFFDINDLAGLRMEEPEVFARTHALIGELIATGAVDALRVDHPDGLYDPAGYFEALRALASARAGPGRAADFWIVVEKILAPRERLPAHWPVDGTTGYESAHLLNGLLVHPDVARLEAIHRRFTGAGEPLAETVYRCKQQVIEQRLSSELTRLASLADAIARSDRHTRDFTYQSLRAAIAELAACFPVYRSYVTGERVDKADLRHIQWATGLALRRRRAGQTDIHRFLEGLLSLEGLAGYRAGVRRQVLRFASRFQQYTAPVSAKGLEDTALYRGAALLSANDVGFDPGCARISRSAFHQENLQRLASHPASLNCTCTHDSKRGEDVRARIDVLSELPAAWRRRLGRWTRLNRARRRRLEGRRAPSRAEEYAFYQTLVGTWPLAGPPAAEAPGQAAGVMPPAGYAGRIAAYMVKAAREAGLHSSWRAPDAEYEAALDHFVHSSLTPAPHNAFLADFLPFVQAVGRCGLLNALSQTLLKLTMPGVPDIYQGNELWAFNLVDPDNRRPVDYALRRARLEALRRDAAAPGGTGLLAAGLATRVEDGSAKLYLIWKALALRRARPALFHRGAYTPLTGRGARAGHLCAFARCLEGDSVLVAAPRWHARLFGAHTGPDLDGLQNTDPAWPAQPDPRPWAGTTLACPPGTSGRFRNVLTGELLIARAEGETAWLDAEALFAAFPVALLREEPQGEGPGSTVGPAGDAAGVPARDGIGLPWVPTGAAARVHAHRPAHQHGRHTHVRDRSLPANREHGLCGQPGGAEP